MVAQLTTVAAEAEAESTILTINETEVIVIVTTIIAAVRRRLVGSSNRLKITGVGATDNCHQVTLPTRPAVSDTSIVKRRAETEEIETEATPATMASQGGQPPRPTPKRAAISHPTTSLQVVITIAAAITTVVRTLPQLQEATVAVRSSRM